MRHPNQNKGPASPYRMFNHPFSQGKGVEAKTPHERLKEIQQRDIQALEAVQASRPAKPPVKSRRVW